MNRLIQLILLGLLLQSCAFGQRVAYHQAGTLDVQASGRHTLVIGVQDQRPYVVSKEKSEDFVGISRGGFGNPFDVVTDSGSPLAEDITMSLVKACRNKGYTVTSVKLSPGTSREDVLQALRRAQSARAVLVRLIEWKTDSMFTTALHYTVFLEIFDESGKLLANNQVNGKDKIEGYTFPSDLADLVPPVFASKMEQLFNHPKVKSALEGS